ncbi:MAG: diheme cytochrome c-553 [Chitinophagaceae bacterium]|nr:diheme cytochrome c-553 [Chitinophagaceae bacterium]
MKKSVLFLAVMVCAVGIALVACTDDSSKSDSYAVVISQDSLVKRGSYLVNAIGCDDCHSPKTFGPQGPELVMDKRFGGHQANTPIGKPNVGVMKDGYMLFGMDLTYAVGPWGMSYAANISSDPTGIGNWTEAQFITAIREGKSKGLKEGRQLLPPMPWFVYKNLDDVDLKAIFAYLKTSKPVNNLVPGPKAITEL